MVDEVTEELVVGSRSCQPVYVLFLGKLKRGEKGRKTLTLTNSLT